MSQAEMLLGRTGIEVRGCERPYMIVRLWRVYLLYFPFTLIFISLHFYGRGLSFI
jgi:hypothetical protein